MRSNDRLKVEMAEGLAYRWHVGQTYTDDRPYAATHLKLVAKIGADAGFKNNMEMMAAFWLHDSIEDVEGETPEAVEEERQHRKSVIIENFGQHTFDLIWAVSGFGHNRKARNADAKEKIIALPKAAIIKVIDRIVNVMASASTSPDKLRMYAKEHEGFAEYIRPLVPDQLWVLLEQSFPAGTIRARPMLGLQLTSSVK